MVGLITLILTCALQVAPNVFAEMTSDLRVEAAGQAEAAGGLADWNRIDKPVQIHTSRWHEEERRQNQKMRHMAVAVAAGEGASARVLWISGAVGVILCVGVLLGFGYWLRRRSKRDGVIRDAAERIAVRLVERIRQNNLSLADGALRAAVNREVRCLRDTPKYAIRALTGLRPGTLMVIESILLETAPVSPQRKDPTSFGGIVAVIATVILGMSLGRSMR